MWFYVICKLKFFGYGEFYFELFSPWQTIVKFIIVVNALIDSLQEEFDISSSCISLNKLSLTSWKKSCEKSFEKKVLKTFGLFWLKLSLSCGSQFFSADRDAKLKRRTSYLMATTKEAPPKRHLESEPDMETDGCYLSKPEFNQPP